MMSAFARASLIGRAIYAHFSRHDFRTPAMLDAFQEIAFRGFNIL